MSTDHLPRFLTLVLSEETATAEAPPHAAHHTTQPFHDTLTKHGFKHVLSHDQRAKAGDKQKYTEHVYQHPGRPKSTVTVNHNTEKWTHEQAEPDHIKGQMVHGDTMQDLNHTLDAYHPHLQDPKKNDFHSTLVKHGFKHEWSANRPSERMKEIDTVHHYGHPNELENVDVELSTKNGHKIEHSFIHDTSSKRVKGKSLGELSDSLDKQKDYWKKHGKPRK